MTLTPKEIAAYSRIEDGKPEPGDYAACARFYKPESAEITCVPPLSSGGLTYNGVSIRFVGAYTLSDDFKRVNRITDMIKSTTGGHCPCVSNDLWDADTLCPCKWYRNGNGCHCGLYVLRKRS